MKASPLVSIIIPTYNSSKFIEGAIESAINQTYKNIEIIVIDDGSTDNTLELLKKYKNIHVITQTNKGVAAARNAGIEIASGDYIAILDSDDRWMKNRLEIMIPLIEKSKCDLIISNYYYVDENRNKISLSPVLSEKYSIPSFEEQYKMLLWKAINFTTMIVRADKIKLAGGYDESLRGEAEDYDLWLRLLRDGSTYTYVDEPLVEYMLRSGSLSKNYSKNRKRALKKIFAKHEDKVGLIKTYILYRYHLGGYRLDMLIISIRGKKIKKCLKHSLLLFLSPVFSVINGIRILMDYSKK